MESTAWGGIHWDGWSGVVWCGVGGNGWGGVGWWDGVARCDLQGPRSVEENRDVGVDQWVVGE